MLLLAGRPFKCAFVHLSHIAWQALAPESRLWVLRGLVEVHAVRAALLDMAPPQTAKLAAMGSRPNIASPAKCQ